MEDGYLSSAQAANAYDDSDIDNDGDGDNDDVDIQTEIEKLEIAKELKEHIIKKEFSLPSWCRYVFILLVIIWGLLCAIITTIYCLFFDLIFIANNEWNIESECRSDLNEYIENVDISDQTWQNYNATQNAINELVGEYYTAYSPASRYDSWGNNMETANRFLLTVINSYILSLFIWGPLIQLGFAIKNYFGVSKMFNAIEANVNKPNKIEKEKLTQKALFAGHLDLLGIFLTKNDSSDDDDGDIKQEEDEDEKKEESRTSSLVLNDLNGEMFFKADDLSMDKASVVSLSSWSGVTDIYAYYSSQEEENQEGKLTDETKKGFTNTNVTQSGASESWNKDAIDVKIDTIKATRINRNKFSVLVNDLTFDWTNVESESEEQSYSQSIVRSSVKSSVKDSMDEDEFMFSKVDCDVYDNL